MGDWIVEWPDGGAGDGLPVLLCLPPAGAGAGQFRPWQQRLAGVARVLGVQLPGREKRWREPMPETFGAAVDAVQAELASVGGDPLVVYGHSFGGLIGYEIARRTTPYALVVSGCRAPRHWDGAGRGIVEADGDDAAVERLLDTGDLDPALLDDELRALMVDMLRKDALLSLSYTHTPGARLDCQVYAWGAAGDTTVSRSELAEWAGVTAGPFRRRTVPGGHHAVLRRPDALLAELTGLLRAAAPARTPARADAAAPAPDRTAAAARTPAPARTPAASDDPGSPT